MRPISNPTRRPSISDGEDNPILLLSPLPPSLYTVSGIEGNVVVAMAYGGCGQVLRRSSMRARRWRHRAHRRRQGDGWRGLIINVSHGGKAWNSGTSGCGWERKKGPRT